MKMPALGSFRTRRSRGTRPIPIGKTKIAIVGCGYVADFYMATLPNHPDLVLVGVYDRDEGRLQAFCRHYHLVAYSDLHALLADEDIDLVLNLTNPASHFDVTSAALNAGKHVYSEKPMTMDFEQARRLLRLAEDNGLSLSCAPVTYLGEAASAVKQVVSSGGIGKIRVVYAELDDGMVFRDGCETWRSASGAPWPADDEFRTGCALQHSGYYVAWLCDLFGPVRKLTAFAARQVDDKIANPSGPLSDDFSVACMVFDDGVVARLTCSLLAPRDRRLRLVGDAGVLTVEDGWDTRSRVYMQRIESSATKPYLDRLLGRLDRRMFALVGRRPLHVSRPSYRVPLGHPGRLDYALGPALQARALRSGKATVTDAAFVLHVTEVTLGIQKARKTPMGMAMTTTFDNRAP